MDKRHTQEKIPEIYLAFFIQCDENSHDGIKNRKLFRNYLSRFSIECTRIDIQFGRPVMLDLNFDEKKVKTKIHDHLAKLSTDDTQKLEKLHIFYFGRYWRRLDTILDLPLLDKIADKVHLTSMEMRKYDEILESDMLNFYSGNEHHSISLNDSMDEFYELATQTDQKHIPLQNIKMDFIKFGSFLAMRNPNSNEAINFLNEIVHSEISSVDLGFIMGNRKIDISEDALDELESQTGLTLSRDTKYWLYDCYMKTSVARYQKLQNGGPSKFYSRSVRSQDSGIVEDGTEDNTYNKYQNQDFERQEKYAIIENIIKNPAVYETTYKTYFENNVLNDLGANNKIKNHTEPKSTEAIKKLSDEISEISPENENIYTYGSIENMKSELSINCRCSTHCRCRTFPMDKFGSSLGSYYHGHPYIGSISHDRINNDQTNVHREVTRRSNGDSKTSDIEKQNLNRGSRKRSHGDTNTSESDMKTHKKEKRFKRTMQSWDKGLYAEPYDPDIFYAKAYEEDSPYEFDVYENEYEYETATKFMKLRHRIRLLICSEAVEDFFNRTRFLRNVRFFWQQILCLTVIGLGNDFHYNSYLELYRFKLKISIFINA